MHFSMEVYHGVWGNSISGTNLVPEVIERNSDFYRTRQQNIM